MALTALELAAGPTRAYGEIKRLVADSFNNSLDTQLERETRAIAELAKQNQIQSVVFNRNGFLYHGRVKALADAAREAGLQF